MLLGGMLAAQGFLNKPELEELLSYERPTKGNSYSRILGLVDVEAWLRVRQA